LSVPVGRVRMQGNRVGLLSRRYLRQ